MNVAQLILYTSIYEWTSFWGARHGKKVICEEDLRGRFRITYNGKELAYKEIERPTARSKKPRIRYGSKAHKPPMSHPYKSRMFNERVARDTARAEIKAMNLKQAPELALKS